MFTRRLQGFALISVLPAASALLVAAAPAFWRVSTQQELLRGEVENLSIDADGRLLLGPATEVVYEATAPFLWALVEDVNGAVWAGSGNDGRLFRVDRDGTATEVFDAAELEIHALAVGPGNVLYGATSPDGRIYRVPSGGSASPFADPDEKYIWALAVDRDGTLYAGTGDRGRIYRIRGDGTAELFYETKATHVLALAFDRDGRLLAGTGSPGQVFRIDREGRGFVLLDSAFSEIRSMRLDRDGALYAAAVSQPPGRASPAPPQPPTSDAPAAVPTVSVSTEVTAVVITDAASSAPDPQAGRSQQGQARGAVYRIAPDGVWDTVWQSSEDIPYDLSFTEEGAILVGTGNAGKLYHVTRNPPRTILLTKTPAQQITSMIRATDGGHYIATSNPGKIFRVANKRASEGTYESDVRDAKTVATWGTLRWNASTPRGARIQLFTRSGNTSTPNETWSPWSAPYTHSDGDPIVSPKARYLQWRAVLSGASESPVLISVTAAYLPRNVRPQIAAITVHPPGLVFQQPFLSGEPPIAGLDELADTRVQNGGSGNPSSPPSPSLGRRIYRKGLQTFVWTARDENDDELRYEVLYREEGDRSWSTLKRDLTRSIFTWDTSAVPDGTYILKVVAADTPSNSPGAELTGELESQPFDIDNSPPVIEMGTPVREGDRMVMPFTVRDSQSAVRRVEFTLDTERWQVIYPVDGIPDSRTEQFRVSLENAGAVGRLIVRATDALDNTATAAGGR
jgi:sugar lactone lactonase YvrE